MDTPLNASQRKFVEACHLSGQSLLAIVSDILDFSRIESGRLELDPQDFLVERMVSQTVEMLLPRASDKGLELTCRIDPALLGRVAHADDTRLRQVLINLIGNATKFTEAGRIDVGVKLLSDGSDGANVRFTVADTGIGIPTDRLDVLFESFRQADSSTTRKYGGTGLGLSICRSLVELMGGEMGVESTEGEGAAFWFDVPIAWSDAALVDEERPPRESLDSTSIRREGRVLLAEDNSVNQMYTGEVLRRAGFEYVIAENGREAADLIQSQRFDLVLMDCQMPEMDGFEATEAIRSAEQEKSHVPIIAMTAHAMKGDRERCLEAGMDAYISKPIRAKTLYETIQLYRGRGELTQRPNL
jgi:CheY-like chemotaxis protein